MPSGWTGTDLSHVLSRVGRLPEEVRASLRSVARRSAESIRNDAARRLRAQQKTSAHQLADAIEVQEDAANLQFRVISFPPSGQSANTTIWNEHGTAKMEARPYMRPAADAERALYRRACEAAVVGLLEQALR